MVQCDFERTKMQKKKKKKKAQNFRKYQKHSKVLSSILFSDLLSSLFCLVIYGLVYSVVIYPLQNVEFTFESQEVIISNNKRYIRYIKI